MIFAIVFVEVILLQSYNYVNVKRVSFYFEFIAVYPLHWVIVNFIVQYAEVYMKGVKFIELLDKSVALHEKHIVSASISNKNLLVWVDFLYCYYMVVKIKEFALYFLRRGWQRWALWIAVIITLICINILGLIDEGADLLGWRGGEITEDLLHIVVVAGMIHHIEDGNKCVLVSVPERTAINEVIAPNIELSK